MTEEELVAKVRSGDEDVKPLHQHADFFHPGVAFENQEKAAVLFKAIDRLPENQKTAFTLHNVEGLSYQEIGAVMRTTLAAIESLIYRAKQNLREYLRDYYAKKV